MKESLNLSWRRMKSEKDYINSWKNISLRKMFAQKMMQIFEMRKSILNFDESTISGSTGKTMSWTARGLRKARRFRLEVTGISILLAVGSNGEKFFQYLSGNNNEVSVANFLVEVATAMDDVDERWKENYIFLMDNCPSHKTPMVRQIIRKLQIPVLFSAPASFKTAIIELIFGALKGKDFTDQDV